MSVRPRVAGRCLSRGRICHTPHPDHCSGSSAVDKATGLGFRVSGGAKCVYIPVVARDEVGAGGGLSRGRGGGGWPAPARVRTVRTARRNCTGAADSSAWGRPAERGAGEGGRKG